MTFTVLGEPIPAARPRVVKGHAFIPERTKQHVALVRAHAVRACQVRLVGPVALQIDFYRSTKRRVDLDNLIKNTMDAMLPFGRWPGVYADDSQVTTLVARKYLDPENPRTVVTVREDMDTWDGEA